jgi:predicted RNase H-like nuclease (RuvC/YqgF family)
MGQQTAGRRVKSNSAKEPTVKMPISHYDALEAKIVELGAEERRLKYVLALRRTKITALEDDMDKLHARIEKLEGFNLGLANESCEQQNRIAELEQAMQVFVNRVDAGEVKSKKTYAQFQSLLVSAL